MTHLIKYTVRRRPLPSVSSLPGASTPDISFWADLPSLSSPLLLCAAEQIQNERDEATAHLAEMDQYDYDAIARLAAAFHPTIQFFVECYLRIRRVDTEPMPAWMTLFGIIYDDNGLQIIAFFPMYDPTDTGAHSGIDGGAWSAAAASLRLPLVRLMHRKVHQRCPIPEVLICVQRHANSVLKHLIGLHCDVDDRRCTNT